MRIFGKTKSGKRGYQSERGAALVTVLLISVPLLMAGGGLIMITAMGVSNTADAAAETKAYYAAEAGAQQVLGVLRGNVAPSPLFVSNPMGGVAPENQITF
jgi:type II secretory pathway component PulK